MFKSSSILRSDLDIDDRLALHLAGTDEYATAGTTANVLVGDTATINIWANFGASACALFQKRQDSSNYWSLNLSSFKQLNFQLKVSGSTKYSALSAVLDHLDYTWNGKWAMYTITAKPGSIALYKNAELLSLNTSSTIGGDFDNTGYFELGRTATTVLGSSKIASIAMYNKFLEARDVRTIYNNHKLYNHGKGIYKDNLTGWYRFGKIHDTALATAVYKSYGNIAQITETSQANYYLSTENVAADEIIDNNNVANSHVSSSV